jgi:hypothetical protein
MNFMPLRRGQSSGGHKADGGDSELHRAQLLISVTIFQFGIFCGATASMTDARVRVRIFIQRSRVWTSLDLKRPRGIGGLSSRGTSCLL